MRRDRGNFIAHWVPTWLIIGYNKPLKLEGHDPSDRGARNAVQAWRHKSPVTNGSPRALAARRQTQPEAGKRSSLSDKVLSNEAINRLARTLLSQTIGRKFRARKLFHKGEYKWKTKS
jgi:hypothetical protein